jgi:hypothetical protein
LLYSSKNNLGVDWTVIILSLCHPTEIRLYEQLAIYLFNPKESYKKNFCKYTRAIARANLNQAIITIDILQNLHLNDDLQYLQFKHMKENLI